MAEARERDHELLEAMLDPAFYPHAPPSVELRETNISWVLLAGELAYKVKKPVSLPFLDYSTAARRREMCHEEVRLNRRLAPEIYLGVVGIVGGGGRYSLAREGDPGIVEHAVEMRRVEEGRSLAALAAAGGIAAAAVDEVAGLLARFHATAAPAPSEARELGVLIATLEENMATIAAVGAGIVGGRALEAASGFTRAFVASRRDLLESRARAGLVRDCHGDLRAEHVIVPAADPAYVYDCVEFNPDLRRIDVAADFAFLIMDLARLGARKAAERLLTAYRAAGGDPGDDALLSFFAAYRAWVRAKIACLSAGAARSKEERRAAASEASELFRLGRRFAWDARGPLVLAVCGIAGSGKTTLARELAELTGWTRASSDETRKRLAGIEPTARAGPEHYSAEATERTYRELGAAAAAGLAGSGGAIVDGTFHRARERDAFRAGFAAAGSDARLVFVECRARPELLAERVRSRERDPRRISDAGEEIVARQLAAYEPPIEVPGADRIELATDSPPERLVVELELEVKP